jgi:hypothetical protein
MSLCIETLKRPAPPIFPQIIFKMITTQFALFMLQLGSAFGQFLKDQKQNCTQNVTSSLCYTPGVKDAMGQYKTCLNPGHVAITFDDGPHATMTPRML